MAVSQQLQQSPSTVKRWSRSTTPPTVQTGRDNTNWLTDALLGQWAGVYN